MIQGHAATAAATTAPHVGAAADARAGFDAEALRHLDALYAFALKLTRARDDAEDLVSDTMLRASSAGSSTGWGPTSAPGSSRSSTTPS